MEFRELAVTGALEITPRLFRDERGLFTEGFRADHLASRIGYPFEVKQTNISVSTAGVVRGIHYADVPPSQAKYVTALSGRFVDFVVDLRVGSPTFGTYDTVILEPGDLRAVYVPHGCGHALACVEDGTAMYLCTEVYAPQREHGIHPLDPDLALDLPMAQPNLSPKDAEAPTFAEVQAAGGLPRYEDCLALVATLASGTTTVGENV